VPQITTELHVRITELPISDKLRDLRQNHLNCLVRVSGGALLLPPFILLVLVTHRGLVVTRRTGVFPQMRSVVFDCSQCGGVLGPFRNDVTEVKPHSCTHCESNGPFKVNTTRTQYGNYQKMTLQESPGSVPPGRVPRYKDIILLGDLIDIARPGEEVEVTGIYRHSQGTVGRRDTEESLFCSPFLFYSLLAIDTLVIVDTAAYSRKKNGFPVFSTTIEANYVQRKGGNINADISEEDKKLIVRMSQDPQVCLSLILLLGLSHPPLISTLDRGSDHQIHCPINLWPQTC
jgi:DNA replication licensing factor MCM2